MSLPQSPPGSGADAWQVSERLLFDFDRAWRDGPPPRIEDYLARRQAAESSAADDRFLEDLVKIDLEYRWRRQLAGDGTGLLPTAPRLEDYVARHAQLGPLDRLSLGLIGEEFLVRRRWGDRPQQAEYVRRFPGHGAALLKELARVETELSADLDGHPAAPALASARPPAALGTTQPVHSVASLAAVLTECELLSAPQQEELNRGLSVQFREPRALAGELIRRGWLTAYQVNQLLSGRGPDLILGPYVLLERLGEGGAGQVFKARHRRMDRLAALKLIRKELLADPEVVGRFRREIHILSQLDHPNIVHAYDAGPAGASYFLAMEFVEGTDLGKLVKQGGPMPVLQASAYIHQAALALQYAHEKGLVHRDIKPHNLVMSVRDGQIKVADLGLARLPRALSDEAAAALTGAARTTGTLTPEHAVMMGTADYLAPEQAMDFHSADIRADLYSLGCTFYFLLTGEPPFPGGNLAQKVARHLQAPPPDVAQLRPDLPKGLAALIRKMLAKRPVDRFQTPAEAAQALAALVQIGPASAKTSPANRTRAGKKVLTLLATSVALLLVFGLLLMFRNDPPISGTSGKDGSFGAKQVADFNLPVADISLPLRERVPLVALSLAGRLVASSGEKHGIVLSDLTTGQQHFTLTGHQEPLTHLAFSPDGRLLASGSMDARTCTWKLWDLNHRKELSSTTVDAPAAKLHPSRAFVGPFSPDGKWLAVCPGDGTVGLVEIGAASQPRIKTTFPKINASTLVFSPDSRTFVMVPAASGRLLAHDIITGQERRFGVDTAYIHALAFSPDGSQLAVDGWNRTLLLLDATPLRPATAAPRVDAVPLKAHWVRPEQRGDTTALAFTPDGKTLSSGSSYGIVKLWNPATGEVRENLPGHAGSIRALAFSADGRSLFTAGAEGTVKVRPVSD